MAAGRGSRAGGDTPKPVLVLAGRPLGEWALEAARTSGAHPVVLVVGHQGPRVRRVAPEGVMIVEARSWRRGLAHSLRAGLRALDGWMEVTAVCVGLADQPLVGADAYRRLVAAHEEGAALAVATYDGVRGNPVLIARSLWPEALALDGDEGGRALMRNHPVVEVDCSGTGSPFDVDTLDDLAAIQETFRH